MNDTFARPVRIHYRLILGLLPFAALVPAVRLIPERSPTANIGTRLKSEIIRLCRRELRIEIEAVKKAAAGHRKDIAALKKQVLSLERDTKRLAKRVPEPKTEPSPDRSLRFVSKALPTLRKRLGLAVVELGLLLGVGGQSVYNYEAKKTTLREELLVALAALRTMGKREAHARLAELKGEAAGDRVE